MPSSTETAVFKVLQSLLEGCFDLGSFSPKSVISLTQGHTSMNLSVTSTYLTVQKGRKNLKI